MATRSSITVREKDGLRLSIYCHWDGYPKHVGRLLYNHYNTTKKALKLVSLGNISSLGKRIKPKKDVIHNFDNSIKNVTVYYGRDMEEENQEPQKLSNSQSIDSQEFNYYFDGTKWYVNGVRLTKKMIS